MYKFDTNSEILTRRIRSKVSTELIICALLLLFFYSDFSKELPNWLEISIMIVFVGYIILGLILYPIVKANAENFSINLLDNALVYTNKNSERQMLYTDLKIMKVKKVNDKIIEIELQTAFSQCIKLKGLINMSDLYEDLMKHGVKNLAQGGSIT